MGDVIKLESLTSLHREGRQDRYFLGHLCRVNYRVYHMQVKGLAGWHLVFHKGFAEVGYLRTTDANTPTLRAKKIFIVPLQLLELLMAFQKLTN